MQNNIEEEKQSKCIKSVDELSIGENVLPSR
jgi:hypothetical protein